VAQRVPGGLGSKISWDSAREGGEVVSLTHQPPLPPGMFLVLIFTRGWVDPWTMEQSEGDMSLKNPMTPPGIDTGTVRLVAQRLNRYATPGPFCPSYCVKCPITHFICHLKVWLPSWACWTRNNKNAVGRNTNFIIANPIAATCFDCTKQPSSGPMNQKM
jgi:hypothetical protein